MRQEGWFWERATAIHAVGAQGSFRGGARFARHGHDVTRRDAADLADSATMGRAWVHAVAGHKNVFFAESTPDGEPIDDHAAVTGTLDPAPSGDARKTLAEGWQRMVGDGLLLGDVQPCDVLLQRCQALALQVNVRCLGPHNTLPCGSKRASRCALVG